MDALKRIEKIIWKKFLNKRIKEPRLKFDPELALIGLWTTGPSKLEWTLWGKILFHSTIIFILEIIFPFQTVYNVVIWRWNLSHLASPTLSDVDNEEETKLLQSEIWTTLFRGGYMTGKLQRSLSGHHVSHFQFIYCSLYFYNP